MRAAILGGIADCGKIEPEWRGMPMKIYALCASPRKRKNSDQMLDDLDELAELRF